MTDKSSNTAGAGVSEAHATPVPAALWEVPLVSDSVRCTGLPSGCAPLEATLHGAGDAAGLFRPGPPPAMRCEVLFEAFGTPALVLENVLSPQECRLLVAATESPDDSSPGDSADGGLSGRAGDETADGRASAYVAASVDRQYRNCTRRQVHSPALAALVWSRVGPALRQFAGVRAVHVEADGAEERRARKFDPRFKLPLPGKWTLRGQPHHQPHQPQQPQQQPLQPQQPRQPQQPHQQQQPEEQQQRRAQSCGAVEGTETKALPLNDVWRFCKYEPGGHFSPHVDGYMRASPDERSFFTFMLYLTDESAGTTNFMARDGAFERVLERDAARRQAADDAATGPVPPPHADEADITHRVRPRQGLLLCFWHFIPHEGGRTAAEGGGAAAGSGDCAGSANGEGGGGVGGGSDGAGGSEADCGCAAADGSEADSAGDNVRGDADTDQRREFLQWIDSEMLRCKYILRSDLWYCRNGTAPAPPPGAEYAPTQRTALQLLGRAAEAEARGQRTAAMRLYSRAYRLWPELQGGGQ